MDARLRTFIAVELPEEIRRGLIKIQNDLDLPGLEVLWVRTEAMHLTLKFLGDINRQDVPEVGRLMRDACEDIEPFTLGVEGLGSFPPKGRPRILWVGLTGQIESLAKMAERLENGARELGAKVEERRYVPHLTLGRVRKSPTDLAELLAKVKRPNLGTFVADGLTLFMSELTRKGSEYTELARVDFS
jgi:RNA 2',3'-cyclic 3'-phosphodiesterase